MKIAKVIATSFVSREIREKTGICGTPPGYFSHSQKFTTPESIIDLIKLNVELEKNCDPGENVDLIIINNDSGYRQGNKYLESLNGEKLKKGIIRVYHRENIGRSFGGYNYAFQKLKDQYEYFIFTEDDIVLSVDGYAKIGLDTFKSNKKCGFVAFQGVTTKFNKKAYRDSIHVHGGVGLSSRQVLDEVVRRYGQLPHATQNDSQSYESIIENGEVAFTNKIYKIGYEICEIKHELKLYDYAYDLMRNIKVQRYATGLNLIKFNINKHFRKKIYELKLNIKKFLNN